MRLIALFTCIFVSFLSGQMGHADIYVWVDENGVKHFTNENPPPHAKVLMRTKENPYYESADRARQEVEKQQDLLQAQAEILELKARLAEQQDEVQRGIAEIEPKAEDTLQHAEDLPASANNQNDSDRRYSYSYGYYPKSFNSRHYRSSKYHYPAHDGIYNHKKHKFRKGHHRFKRHRSGKSHHFRKHFKAPKFRHGKIHKKFNTGRHHFRRHHFKGSRVSRFRHHAGGRVRIHGHHRGGFGRR
jgi:hypothetical protein